MGRRVYKITIPANLNGYISLSEYAGRLGTRTRRPVVMVTMENDIVNYDRRDHAQADPVAAPTPRQSIQLLDIKQWATAHSELYFLATSLIHGSTWLKEMAIQSCLVADNLAACAAAAWTARQSVRRCSG